jgi:serine/threonine-protein kinase
MPFRGTPLDREFARQSLAEKRLSEAQVNELIGAQCGLLDRGTPRALPVLAHEMDFLSRLMVEQLIRHILRRLGGFQIGGYRVVRQLGRGGMGVVYLAEQLSLKRPVALKLLIRRDMSQKFVDRFNREGRACATVRQQYLVAAFDVGTADGWHYFSMEYVDGPTITRAVREGGALSELEGIRIARQVGEALACAHDAGIIHRDIKPGNIMLTKSGTPKLCDLGLARIRNVDESELYEPGTTLGSRRYMSPEQARGLKGIDQRSDIYSLGLTLFYMLTGVPPFSDVPKEQVMLEHIRGLLEWPSDINPNISDEASSMIWRLSAKEPERRPQTAHELVDELRVLENKLGERAGFGPGGLPAESVPEELSDEAEAAADASTDD